MPKVKVKRTNPTLDMTPMVDLAFLLVTFFMLTTKFAPEEVVQVDTPSSVSEIKLPETDVITISIDKDSRVFFGVDGQYTKERLLQRMAERYNVSFTPEETKTFTLLPSFGVPVANLRQYLNLHSPEERKEFPQPGIPLDSAQNELGDWVQQARLSNPKVVIAIKGDQDANYPIVEKVISTLQDRKINRFNLITSMEEKPKVQ